MLQDWDFPQHYRAIVGSFALLVSKDILYLHPVKLVGDWINWIMVFGTTFPLDWSPFCIATLAELNLNKPMQLSLHKDRNILMWNVCWLNKKAQIIYTAPRTEQFTTNTVLLTTTPWQTDTFNKETSQCFVFNVKSGRRHRWCTVWFSCFVKFAAFFSESCALSGSLRRLWLLVQCLFVTDTSITNICC